MRLCVLILSLLLCIIHLDAQQNRPDASIHVPVSSHMADALEEIERQTNYSFLYDARVIDLSAPLTSPLEGRTVFEILNRLFKDTEIAYTIVNEQIILSKKEEIIRMRQQSMWKVTGVVTDQNGDPAAFVNVVRKGTTYGTITDLNGRFALDLPDKAILVFSYVGFVTQEIKYEGQASVNVRLTEDTKRLGEVVVTRLSS